MRRVECPNICWRGFRALRGLQCSISAQSTPVRSAARAAQQQDLWLVTFGAIITGVGICGGRLSLRFFLQLP